MGEKDMPYKLAIKDIDIEATYSEEVARWVGPDIRLAAGATVGIGRDSVQVQINPDSLPPMQEITRDSFSHFYPSGRSRYAQLGLTPLSYVSDQIFDAMIESESISSSGEVTKPFNADISVYNQSLRPISLDEGVRLFRMFSWVNRPAAEGKELIDLVSSGKVKISGEYGRDWSFGRRGIEDAKGIYVKIADHKLWVPPGAEPIHIDDNDSNYREEIDQILEKAPKTSRSFLWIGETESMIELHEGIDAILYMQTYFDVFGRPRSYLDNSLGDGTHIPSQFLEGGRTNWKIRLEIESPTAHELTPNAVFIVISPKSGGVYPD